MLLFYNSYMYNNNSKGLVIVVMVYRKFIWKPEGRDVNALTAMQRD